MIATTQELAQTLFEEAGDALVLFDPENGRIVNINPVAMRFTGMGRPGLLKETVETLFRSEKQGGVARLQRAYRTTGRFHAEDGYYLRQRKDGTWLPVNLTVSRLHAKPKTLGLITARDVSERKRSEAALRESEARNRAILESALDCIITIDHHGMIIEFNPAAQRTFGHSREAAVGRSVAELIIPAACRAAHARGLVAYLNTGVGPILDKRIEVTALRADGTEFPVELTVTAVRTAPPVFTAFLRDITERKRAEEAVRATSDLLRAVADGTTDAVFVKGRDGKYLLFNEAAAGFVGKPVVDVLGRDDTELFDPDSARRVMDRDQRVMESGRADTVEETLTAAGTTRTYLASKAPYRDAAGTVIGLIGISRDITDRKRAEEAVLEREALLQTIITHIPCGVFWKDRDSVLLGCNNQFAQDFGAVSPEDLIGKTDNLMSSRADAEAFVAGDRRVIETGEPLLHVEEPHARPDGQATTILTSKVPLRGPSGAVIGVLGVYQDITDRKRAEETQRREREFIRLVLDTDPNLIFVKDGAGRIVLANKAMADLYGTTPDELVGRHPGEDMASPNEIQEYRRDEQQVLRTRRPTAIDETNTRPDGRTYWFHTIKVPIELPGGYTHVLGIAADITERKRSEQRLRTQHAVVNILAESPNLRAAAPRLLQAICETTGWDVGDLWVVDRQTHVLSCVDCWNGESMDAAEFCGVTRRGTFAPGECLPGRVWAARQPNWIVDISTDSNMRRAAVAAKAGLRAGFGFPIQFGNEVLGVAEFFSRESRQPDAELLRMFDTLGSQIGQFIERKRAEEGLGLFRNLIDQTTDGIEVIDPETGRFLDVNERACVAHGYTREEFLSLSVPDIDPIVASKSWGKMVMEGHLAGSQTMESLHRRKDGSTFPVEVSFNTIGLDREYMVAVVRDITERKRAEAALDERVRLASLVADIGIALVQGNSLPEILTLCAEALVRRLDAAFARVWTLNDAGDMLELQASAGLYTHTNGPHGRVPVGQFKIGLIAEERKSHFTNAVVGDLRVGDQDWAKREGMVAFAGYPLLVGERLVGVVAVFSRQLLGDATMEALASVADQIALGIDRKRAEAALREREDRFRALIEKSFDGIFLLGRDGVIVYASPSATRILGYPRDEFIGMHFSQLVPREDLDEHTRRHERIVNESGVSVASRNRYLNKDGSGHWLEVQSTNMLAEPSVRAKVVNFRDVTEQRQLEEQFRQSQKMDAVGQLAGGVAHDFNNLLSIINGYSELLLSSLAPDDPSRESLEQILWAGERSAGLTRQLLAFSRQQVLAPRILDLNTVVADTEKMLRRIIGEDVALATALAPALGAVRADPGQVEQILLNLAVNARDAMPTGGRLTIETRNVELDEQYARLHADAKAGPHVLLAVTDTGRGIPSEVMAKIFEPFFTTKGPGKGTGLGLATVYGIVRQSGGHIGVYSEVGIGTTFKVYLPRERTRSETSKSRSGVLAPPRGTETVLVVEDEDGVRALTRIILAGCGYTLLEAADGAEAVRVAAGHLGPIHMLVSDVVMPGLGGRLVADRVAELHPEVRVLFVSGYTDDAVVRHGVLQEGVNFLQKPFSPVALAHKVREVLDG